MKKNYNTALLSGGIAIILAQISAFVLQDYFGRSYLTLAFQFDTFVLLALAFMLILQFKSSDKIAAILLVVYGGFNILHGITANYSVGLIVNNLESEVIFILGLLIGHVLFEISALFLVIHITQTKFETSFTKKIVLFSLSVSIVLLASVSFLVTEGSFNQILKTVVAVIALIAVYASMYLLIAEKPITEGLEEDQKEKNKLQELEGLYHRGIITQAEYDERKEKLTE